MNSKLNQQMTQQGAQNAVSPLVQLFAAFHHVHGSFSLHQFTPTHSIPGDYFPYRHG